MAFLMAQLWLREGLDNKKEENKRLCEPKKSEKQWTQKAG